MWLIYSALVSLVFLHNPWAHWCIYSISDEFKILLS